jgi:Kinetochore complex Fta4 of Sim4 subunit, or CENP-50
MIIRLAENVQESSEFSDHLLRLKALSERRSSLRQKVRLYKTVQNHLQPLKSPQMSIQPNLVARDGPLAEELVKAKSLGIRLTGSVARLKHVQRKTIRSRSPSIKDSAPGQHDIMSVIHQELAGQH